MKYKVDEAICYTRRRREFQVIVISFMRKITVMVTSSPYINQDKNEAYQYHAIKNGRINPTYPPGSKKTKQQRHGIGGTRHHATSTPTPSAHMFCRISYKLHYAPQPQISLFFVCLCFNTILCYAICLSPNTTFLPTNKHITR